MNPSNFHYKRCIQFYLGSDSQSNLDTLTILLQSREPSMLNMDRNTITRGSMSVTGFPWLSQALPVVHHRHLLVVTNQLRHFSSNQSVKGHSKDKLQESKLIQAVHLYFQITNLIYSYCKISNKLQIY